MGHGKILQRTQATKFSYCLYHGPIIGRKKYEYCNTFQVISVDDGKEKVFRPNQ